MITSRNEYRFVEGDINDVIINGEIMPFRTGTGTSARKCLRGEDICFLREGIAERDAATGYDTFPSTIPAGLKYAFTKRVRAEQAWYTWYYINRDYQGIANSTVNFVESGKTINTAVVLNSDPTSGIGVDWRNACETMLGTNYAAPFYSHWQGNLTQADFHVLLADQIEMLFYGLAALRRFYCYRHHNSQSNYVAITQQSGTLLNYYDGLHYSHSGYSGWYYDDPPDVYEEYATAMTITEPSNPWRTVQSLGAFVRVHGWDAEWTEDGDWEESYREFDKYVLVPITVQNGAVDVQTLCDAAYAAAGESATGSTNNYMRQVDLVGTITYYDLTSHTDWQPSA